MNRLDYITEFLEGMRIMKHKMLCHEVSDRGIQQVTFSQLRVLELISRSEPMSIKEIHQSINISSSAATQIVNELVKKKHVVRAIDTSDKRISIVRLSPKTKKSMISLNKKTLANVLSMFECLSDKEFKTYIELNMKIINNTN